MMNVYNGNVTTDDAAATPRSSCRSGSRRSTATSATSSPCSAAAPGRASRVARRIEGNRFVIQTDVPATEVSWQVTGIRKDPFAERNRIPVEQEKPEAERGLYLHPEAWGRPPEEGVDFHERLIAVESVRRALDRPVPEEGP